MPTVLITTGPTREFLDPIRFISNNASGRLGYYIARNAYRDGYEVTLIKGPVKLPRTNFKTIDVVSSKHMLNEVKINFKKADIFISAAAVCDFEPKKFSYKKLKRGILNLKLAPTVDILREVSKVKKKGQMLIGFCVETNDLIKNALLKLKQKGLDLIISNPVSNIGSDYGEAIILSPKGIISRIEKTHKRNLARKIWEIIKSMYLAKRARQSTSEL